MTKQEIVNAINKTGTHTACCLTKNKIQVWRKFNFLLGGGGGFRDIGETYLGFFKKSEAIKILTGERK